VCSILKNSSPVDSAYRRRRGIRISDSLARRAAAASRRIAQLGQTADRTSPARAALDREAGVRFTPKSMPRAPGRQRHRSARPTTVPAEELIERPFRPGRPQRLAGNGRKTGVSSTTRKLISDQTNY